MYQSSAVESVPMHCSGFVQKVTLSCLDKAVNISVRYSLSFDSYNKTQRDALFLNFILVKKTLHVSDRFTVHHQDS